MQDLLSVIVGAFIFMGVGSIWYGPLFGEMWLKACGKSQKDIQKNMQKTMAMATFFSLLASWGMNYFAANLLISDSLGGAQLGFFTWVAFALSTIGITYTYEQTNAVTTKLYLGYTLISYILTGVVVSVL